MLAPGVPEAVPEQVHDAGLGDRPRPNGTDRIRQAGQAVTHDHQHIRDAAVTQLGQHMQPVLRALTAVTDPQPQDVAMALTRHRQGDISSTPDRFCRLATILGSNDPSRSRGTSMSTEPTWVSTVLERIPLREFPSRDQPDHACHSQGDR